MRGGLIYSVGNCCKPQAQDQRRKKARVRRNRSSSKLGRVKRKSKQKSSLFQTASEPLKEMQRHYLKALLFSLLLQHPLQTTTTPPPKKHRLYDGEIKAPLAAFSPLRASPHYAVLAHSARPQQPQPSTTAIKTLFS